MSSREFWKKRKEDRKLPVSLRFEFRHSNNAEDRLLRSRPRERRNFGKANHGNDLSCMIPIETV